MGGRSRAPADPCAALDARRSQGDWWDWAPVSQHFPRVPPRQGCVCRSQGHRTVTEAVGTPQHCPVPRDTTGMLCWLWAAGAVHRESSGPARIPAWMLGRAAAWAAPGLGECPRCHPALQPASRLGWNGAEGRAAPYAWVQPAPSPWHSPGTPRRQGEGVGSRVVSPRAG